MKTLIRYKGKEYVELNNKAPRMINKKCNCGNLLNVPIGVLVLGIVKDCAHCNKNYPSVAHCKAITQSYIELIEDGGIVDLN